SNEACLEALVLMLASHNILHPASGAPITLPSQDMILGVYYLTKFRPNQLGENMTFANVEDMEIAFNEGKVAKHAKIKIRLPKKDDVTGKVMIDNKTGQPATYIQETTVGRVILNKIVPEEVPFVNTLLSKKALRSIIGDIFRRAGMVKTVKFLDDMKDLGFQEAFKAGLTFSLSEVIIPTEKVSLIAEAKERIAEVEMNRDMGLLTETERYNQVIDIWTHVNSRLTSTLIKQMEHDKDGFNVVYMMMHSGARGSETQIRQLGGMRGLMAKPQKTLKGSAGEIIENPILANFKEGLSVLEYFISTHGARKGLADTALKTADAGYLTRRLVDVAQDVIITEYDCGTLRGITLAPIRQNDEVIEKLGERVLGRVTLEDIIHPHTGDVILEASSEITESIARQIDEFKFDSIEIRSVLTCESKQGVCSKCYGRNLASGRIVQEGEAVGVVAAQSIGEPGTQLTLRTFHTGGTAQRLTTENELRSKFTGRIELEDVRTVEKDEENVVISRAGKVRIIDAENRIVFTNKVPYGSTLFVTHGQQVTNANLICSWDPYNSLILSEVIGTVLFKDIKENINLQTDTDETTGNSERVVIESRDKTLSPSVEILDLDGELIRSFNLPVGAHLVVPNNSAIIAGQVLVKIPRSAGRTADITGGLPRVTELFEARNPSNPAITSAIEGIVRLGGIKRGSREVFITAPDNSDEKKYMVSISKHLLVHDGDYIMAGDILSDGAMAPKDILAIKGPSAVQAYIVNEIQEVYRMQGVPINDKHIEVIVRQMMQKVEILDAGDTIFLEKEIVDKIDFQEENIWIFDKLIVEDAGDSSNLKPGQIITRRKLRDENSHLRRKDKKLAEARPARPAVCQPILMGITRASLGTKSWLSAASFQETTKVLSEAATMAKVDDLRGLKENVIVGHLIPAGTGIRRYYDVIVAEKQEHKERHETPSGRRRKAKEYMD
ncbi:MAG: DNA-directed RNA polymerase subunit beta', partial [Bacteroidia bacterium]